MKTKFKFSTANLKSIPANDKSSASTGIGRQRNPAQWNIWWDFGDGQWRNDEPL